MQNFTKTCAFCLRSLEKLANLGPEESARKLQIAHSLSKLLLTDLRGIQFYEDTVSTYRSLRAVVPSALWASPLVRKILYDYCICFVSPKCRVLLFESLSNYIQNTPIVYKIKECYPLHSAVLARDIGQIRRLARGDDPTHFYVDMNAPDPLGNTPLMLAVKFKYFQESLALLDHGADSKYRFCNGPCPIEQALATKQLSILRLLVLGYHKNLRSH